MMPSQCLEQSWHGGVWGVRDLLSLAQCDQVSVQGSVDAINSAGSARRSEERFGVGDCSRNDYRCIRRKLAGDHEAFASIGEAKELVVQFLGTSWRSVLMIKWEAVEHSSDDSSLISRCPRLEDFDEPCPGRAFVLIRVDIEVAILAIERSMTRIAEVAQIATFNSDPTVDDPLNFARS